MNYGLLLLSGEAPVGGGLPQKVLKGVLFFQWTLFSLIVDFMSYVAVYAVHQCIFLTKCLDTIATVNVSVQYKHAC